MQRYQLKLKLLPLIIFSILCIYGCHSPSSKKQDHLVFRYNETSNITSLDPAFASKKEIIWATNQIYNSLVQLDDSLMVMPDIAKSWKISSDLTTYTFHLRNDVFFHNSPIFKNNTRKVIADDFSYSIDRLKDPKVAGPGSWTLDQVDSYKAINDTTFQIQLKRPFPAFLSLLAMRYFSVIPKEQFEGGYNYRKKPIGTGAFYVKAWTENEKLVLRKNPLYFEKDTKGLQLPYLEAVAISFLPDKHSEFLQFVQGKLDLLPNVDTSYKDDLLTVDGKLQKRYQGKFQMQKGPSLNSEYIGIYLDHKDTPVANKQLRKAINYGFDRKKMMTFLRNNIGFPAEGGFIPKGIVGHNPKLGYTYQPKKARFHLKQYKKETGDHQPKVHLTTVADYVDLCEFIQRELEKFGITIYIDVLPAPQVRKQKHNGELPLFRASWIADYPDAENFMLPYYSKNHTPNGPNYTHFSNSTFDRLYEKSFLIPDILERKEIYKQMDSIIIEEAPIIPLYYDEVVRFTQPNVKGLPNNAQDFLYLKRVKKVSL